MGSASSIADGNSKVAAGLKRRTSQPATHFDQVAALSEDVTKKYAELQKEVTKGFEEVTKERDVALARAEAAERKLEAVNARAALGGDLYFDSRSGHALGKLITAGIPIALISTPEHGAREGGGAPYDVPAMVVAEQLVSHLAPFFVAAYDFKDSASQLDCAGQEPDCRKELDWSNPADIKRTQWCRYWMGKGRATLASLLIQTEPLKKPVKFNGQHSAVTFNAGMRVAIAISVSGGVVTQTEKELLPGVIRGTICDLCTRHITLGGEAHILWLHFESAIDLIKALQGYGGFCVLETFHRNKAGLPGYWKDGEQITKFDVLANVPGGTPTARREHLSSAQQDTMEEREHKMFAALKIGAVDRVKDFLEKGVSPNARHDGTPTGITPVMYAAEGLQPGFVSLLLANRADVSLKGKNSSDRDSYNALEYFERFRINLTIADANLQDREKQVRELLQAG